MQTNDALKAQFTTSNQAWDSAFNSQQPALVASFYDDEASLLPSGAAQVTGGKAILDFWRDLIGQGVVDHKLELLEVGADETLAFQRGRWSAAAVNAAGERQEFSGNVHLLYRRQADGSWKLYTHTWN